MAIYDEIGRGYARGRRTDPRWMARIEAAVGAARDVVNVGAGTGSYEPAGTVLAVEPSREMVEQRLAAGPVVRAVAEALPLVDGAVEVALAVLTVHHWTDWRRGLAELRRVARRQVVLAYDVGRHVDFWVTREYVPEIAELERGRPGADAIAEELGAERVEVLPVPADFVDGVFPAYWRRPEAYLDERVRRSCSAFAQTDPRAVERGMKRLERDLADGTWHRDHADLLSRQEIDAGFRLITSRAQCQ